MRARHITGAIFVLIAGAILAYLGILTYMQYQTTGELDWPLILRGKGFSGTVLNVSDTSLELESDNGKTEKFVIDRGTRMILGDDKLHPGMFVKVIYKETKQMNIAKAIRKVRKSKNGEGENTPMPSGTPSLQPGTPGTPDISGSPTETPGMKPGQSPTAEPTRRYLTPTGRPPSDSEGGTYTPRNPNTETPADNPAPPAETNIQPPPAEASPSPAASVNDGDTPDSPDSPTEGDPEGDTDNSGDGGDEGDR